MKLSLALSQSLLLSSAAIVASATTGTRGGEPQQGLEFAFAESDISLSLPATAAIAAVVGPSAKGGMMTGGSGKQAKSAKAAPKEAKSAKAASKEAKSSKAMGTFTAPHEVHQFEQVKFLEEPEWECEFDTVAGVTGCLKCRNPREVGEEALVVQVKAMYKRENYNVKDETVNPPRNHCIFPGRGYFWTCFNSNLVIEPDSEWLGEYKDKPIYDADGNAGDQCLPGSIAKGLPDNGAIYPSDVIA